MLRKILYLISSKRIIISGILCGIILFSIIAYRNFQGNSHPSVSTHKSPKRSFSKPFHDFKGFDYTKTENGKHVFRIVADRFKQDKAKVGLLRFGLMKQVVFENARIKITQNINRKKDDILSVVSDSKILSEFNMKRSMRIVFKPVEIQILSDAGNLLTIITAGIAELDKQKQKIIFKDNVTVKSGSDMLFTSTFMVVSKSGDAVAQDGYHIITPEKDMTGNRLLTNIFLTIFNDISKGEL